jgi:hypothetical protein
MSPTSPPSELLAVCASCTADILMCFFADTRRVSLRFLLDKGIAAIPSAHTADYMLENLHVHTTAVRQLLSPHSPFPCQAITAD